MTKDEILKKSRKENTIMDEREAGILAKAGNLAGTASIVLACVLMMFNTIADGPDVLNSAMWAVVWCSNTILYGYQAFHLKKRSYWFLTILYAAAGLACIWAFLFVTLGWG